jgi:hypothetical protein
MIVFLPRPFVVVGAGQIATSLGGSLLAMTEGVIPAGDVDCAGESISDGVPGDPAFFAWQKIEVVVRKIEIGFETNHPGVVLG